MATIYKKDGVDVYDLDGQTIDVKTGQAYSPDSSTIAGADITPEPSLNFQTTPPETPYNVAGLGALPPITLTDEEKKAQQEIEDIQGLTKGLEGEEAFRTTKEEELGISGLTKTQTDLSARLKTLQNEALAIPLQLQQDVEGRGVTKGGLAPIEAGVLRKNAIAALGVASLLEASRGNLTTALDLVDRAVEKKYGPVKKAIEIKKANLDLILKSPKYTIAEKNRAQTQKEAQDKRLKEIEKQEKEQETIHKTALTAASNGADALTLDAIQKAKTSIEAMRIAEKAGFLESAFDKRKREADLAKTESETAENLAQARKAIADAKSSGVAGMNPTDLIAYANQYASTGTIPTGLPKGTFGVVAQFAKEMPKPDGSIVDVNTGTKPAISDAKIDGLAALYDITKKTQELADLNKGRFKGTIAGSLGKVFGSSAQQKYIDLRTEIIDLLARARTGAALTVSEEAFYTSQLPGRLTESFFLGPASEKRIENFSSKINGTLKTKLSANQASIVGYTTVNLEGTEYKVGDIIEANGVKGRVLADGSIVIVE